MSFVLYDPRSDSLEPVSSAAPQLALASSEGPAGLAALRAGVLRDLLARQLEFHPLEPDADIEAELPRFCKDALGGACEPESLRFWLLGTHYREPLVLAPAAEGSAVYPQLEEADRQLAYLYATKQRLQSLPDARIVRAQTQPPEALARFSDALVRALEADLDSPRGLAELHGFLIAVNALCDAVMRKNGRANASSVDSARAGLSTALGALGIGAERPEAFMRRVRDRRAVRLGLDIASVNALVRQRTEARSAGDYDTADRLQQSLLERGVTLIDGPHGTSWTC